MTFEDVPRELTSRPQWVAWRLVPREGEPKPTKVPFNARSGQHASTTDPSTWSTFEEACQFAVTSGASGVGYVLSESDPFTGIDLDACRDKDSGTVEGWAKAIVRRLASYTEISPSGTGLRIFVKGELPPHGRRKGHIEVYCKARFLTITGDRYYAAASSINERQTELLDWHREIFGDGPQQRTAPVVVPPVTDLGDVELLKKARQANNGAKFWALWNGDYSAYTSQSEADLALANLLAYWAGPDPSRIDALFRLSGLVREKWEQRADYRDWTISKALEGRSDYYDPSWRSSSVQLGGSAAIPTDHVDEQPWRSAAELERHQPAEVRQLVEHFLWEGRTHWMYSGPGAGKTLIELAALMHMATGRSFCGLEVVQGAVCIIEEDSPDTVIVEYLRMLAEIYEIDLEGLPLYFNRRRGIRLTEQAGFEYVREMIAKAPIKPAVCLIDACERVVPSEHFNSRELDWLAKLFALNLADGITNVMIDHTRKTQPGGGEKVDMIDLLYGGRTKSAISDVMMYVSGAIKNRAMVTFPKFRGVEPTPVQISFDGSAGFTIKPGAPKLTESERQIMLVVNNAFGRALTREDIEKEAKLTKTTALRAINKLMNMGWMTRLGDNRDAHYIASPSAVGVFS